MATLKHPHIDSNRSSLDTIKRPQDLKNINLNDIDNLIREMNTIIIEKDNIVDLGNGKEVYFRDIFNFLHDIKNGKINDFNKNEEYRKKFWVANIKLSNKTKNSKNIRLYGKYLNSLRRILFDNKRSSGRGLTFSSLPILLSKIYTNNSSKELINNIKQLVKNLYDNKLITKQVYNILNKAITYKE